MTKTILLGATLAAVFAVSMLTSPIWANGDGLSITKASFDEFSMQTDGAPGQTTDGHDIVVYAFFTDRAGKAANTFVAFVAAVHPTFTDDNEQKKDATVVHAHALELDIDTLCVTSLAKNPTASVDGNEVRINGGHGNIGANVIAGYDANSVGLFGGFGICPTEVYALITP